MSTPFSPKKFDSVYEIKCRFCGLVGGTIEYDSVNGKPPKDSDFADNRCDADTLLYGTFKEMWIKATQDLGLSYDEFKVLMVKCEYKKPLFKKEFSKIKTDKMTGFKDLPKKEQDLIISRLEDF